MLYFSSTEIKKLKKYLWVKNKPWKIEQTLWEKVARYTSAMAKIPWIECICVCNSLAMNACHTNSDIDLFIISKKNRLWTARIYMTLLFFFFGERKNQHKHAGKFCLSFFVSESEKSFKDIILKDDIYFYYWIKTLKPIINRNHSLENFLEQNKLGEKNENKLGEKLSSLIPRKKLLLKLWDFQEYILKSFFLRRTLKSYTLLWKPFGVIISDTMLKFHNKDQRKIIREEIFWEKK